MARRRVSSLIKAHKVRFTILIVALGLIAFRLYLPTLALNYANQKLNEDPNYRGSIQDVRLHIWRGAYSAIDLKIERVKGQKQFPFIAVELIDVGLSWRDLFKGSVVAKVLYDRPVINLVQEPAPEAPASASAPAPKKEVALGGATKKEKKAEVRTWHEVFKDLIPLDISRLTVRDGSLHFRDVTSKPQLNVYLDQIQVYGENLTNSEKVAKSLFGKIELQARAMRSGRLTSDLFINPTADPLEAKLTLKLVGLDLTNLNDLFTAYAKFNVKKGIFDFYSEIALAKNEIKGYVKPLIKDLQVADFKFDIKKGLGHALWEEVVGAAGYLLKNHPDNQQGVRIPFEGRVDKPDTDVWAAVVSVFQNIFIKALPPGVEHSVKLSDVKKK